MTEQATGQRIKSYIERVERLESQKAEVAEDIKEVFSEAKASGFCPKTIKKLVRLRKISKEKRQEEQMMLETYASAIQMELFA